jgi:hypothetical protein
MDKNILKHWAGTGIVVLTAGFVVFGLVYGKDFMADFLKNQETNQEGNIEMESGFIEPEQKPEKNRKAVIYNPKLSVSPQEIIFYSPTPSPVLTPISQISLTPFPTPTPTLSITQTPNPTFIPSPTEESVSTPTYLPTPEPTPNQKQAECQPGQVDINIALKQELMKIIHIGDARANDLIILRPFSSVDDMDRISGIGLSRLKDIKDEGIACVQ